MLVEKRAPLISAVDQLNTFISVMLCWGKSKHEHDLWMAYYHNPWAMLQNALFYELLEWVHGTFWSWWLLRVFINFLAAFQKYNV